MKIAADAAVRDAVKTFFDVSFGVFSDDVKHSNFIDF